MLNHVNQWLNQVRPAFIWPSINTNRLPLEPASPITASPPSSGAKLYQPVATDVIEYKQQTLNNQKTIVQSLHGGQQIFDKVESLFTEAEQSRKKPWLLLNLYELQNAKLYPERKCPPHTPGSLTQASLIERIIKLHKEGKAHIRVILDNSKQQPRELEKGGAKVLMEPYHNDRTIGELKRWGVPTLTYPKPAALKNHVKLFILDNNKALVGGMNWGNHSAANHDACVYLEGPDVKNLFHQVFKPDWETCLSHWRNEPENQPWPLTIETNLPTISPFSQGKIKVLQTTGKKTVQGPKDEILGEILKQIDQAQDSIQAQLFVLTHKKVVDALIQKHRSLKQQGKKGVQILVDEGLYQVFPNCRKGIQKLDDAGVPIRFLVVNREREEKLHSKWAVFDEKRLLIGSANWSSLGLDSREGGSALDWESSHTWLEEAEEGGSGIIPFKTNHEIGVCIEDAPKVAKAFSQQASDDFSYRKNHPWSSKPVAWAKKLKDKPWSEQPETPKRKEREPLATLEGTVVPFKRRKVELMG